MKKMRKQFAMVMVVIMMLSALTAMPVLSGSGDENVNITNVNKTNETVIAEHFYQNTEGKIIDITTIANQTSISVLELPISIAATGDLVGKIAFVSDRDGDDEIYVMDADGTNVKKLTSNTVWDSNPAWSPDCKEIAFSTGRYSDKGEICVMDADGTNIVRLTSSTAWDTWPDWSPDGRKIAFESDGDGDKEIYVMDADGTNVKKLTDNTAWDDAPAWSPDGSKISFDSNRDGNFEIYAMNADGTNVVKLTKTASVLNQKSCWSPDGSRIAFTSDKDGDNEIYVMDADGTNVRQLTTNTADEWCSDWCCPIEVEVEVEFKLESIKVLTEAVFELPFKVATAGYTLFVINASVNTSINTHNVTVEVQLWDKNEVTGYDRDISYLGETIANKARSFRVELYHDQPIALEDTSIKCFFKSDELTTPLRPS